MATSEPKLKTMDSATNTEDPADKLIPVIEEREIEHFRELGLGRGMNSTDPYMWRNKIPLQIRNIAQDLSNVIGTDETGIQHRYEKIVSSLQSQQSKIKLALFVPSSTVKISLDAHYSQSTNSTVTIKGDKVRTRTVSFQSDFDDLPNEFKAEATTPTTPIEKDRTFENNMATWILGYLQTKQKSNSLPSEPHLDKLEGDTAIEKLIFLGKKIDNYESEQAKAILLACQMFVFGVGITHYVSSIELGAIKYSAEADTTFQIGEGFGDTVEAASMATVTEHVDTAQETKLFTEKEQLIGHFDAKTGAVRRDTTDEAVIGFQMQPISKLLRTPLLQLAMRAAIEIYIQQGQDNTIGPFLVSTTLNKVLVYWKVDQDAVRATEAIEEASLFYLVSGQDSSFLMAYWGDDREDRKPLEDTIHFHSELSKEIPKLPRFITANTNLLGHSKGPLLLKSTYSSKEAKFTLYSRAQRSFACISWVSTTATIQTWEQGEEFFLKHQTIPFKKDYVAIVQENGELVSTIQPWITDAENGMLFRLHSSSLKKNATKATVTTDETFDDLAAKITALLSLFGLETFSNSLSN